ncbi:MAG: GNAT family N-acetyltransferase [Phocaeicola sp.]
MMKEKIIHNSNNYTFQIEEEEFLAFLSYTYEDGVLNLLSVQVPKALEGRGIAAALTQRALEYAREKDYKVIPICPYVKAYIERYPDYQTLLL